MLSHSAARFRNWKTYLTKNLVLEGIKWRPDEFSPRKPKGYEKLIPDEDWKKFVECRMSDEWLALRKKMQDVQAMNKYNHKLGRGGYVRAEAELEKQLGHQVNGFDRADLWAITKSFKKKASGNHKVSEDVLTKALGTPEERGRVRGVGFGVTLTQFWNTQRPRSSKGKEKQILTSDVEQRFCEQEERIRKQEELVRQQHDQIRKQQELFRQQQEAFHREQELFRRQQEELMRKMF
ncbi:hypothetical protein CsatB_001327 [Cannabis sativa]|uniref:Uncharacterized protein n=1 Tax=Cannabis sativa TaxID=3483 RepID=A0A803QF92_CANSA